MFDRPLRAGVDVDPANGAEVDGYDDVIVPIHADQRRLATLSVRLDAFIRAGGSVLVNSHVAHPFLPQPVPFMPAAGRGLEALRIHREVDHALFEGVPTDVPTFTKGVAGFYSRGDHRRPICPAKCRTGSPRWRLAVVLNKGPDWRPGQARRYTSV